MTSIREIDINTLLKFLTSPSRFIGGIRWVGMQINAKIHRWFDIGNGVEFMNEDWDNLIILDGCRYDVFSERNQISGELQSKQALGSQSWDFMQQNFVDKTFHDTVYVTSNPFASRLDKNTFHAVINLLDEWDPELQTVHPETVVEAARRAHSAYPNKRLLIHFMQPHYPFIGPAGQQIEHKGHGRNHEDQLEGGSIWSMLRLGSAGVTENEVWTAYCENLDIVLPYAQRLLNEISGKSVITSDHGNLVGERLWPIPVRGYGHPRGLRAPQLLTVPWLVVESEERRDIWSDPPVTHEKPTEETVSERLRALGYQE